MRSGDTPVIQMLMFHYNDCNNLIYRINNNNVIAAVMSELCRTVSSVGFVFVFSVLYNNNNNNNNNNYYYYYFIMIKQTAKNSNETDDRHSSLAINIKLKFYHHCHYYVRHIMMNNVI